ncbi:Nef-associated protein 1 [Gryllus bimaculatus]|nr:Nef-associated protein 1 [Gryllus bimaculatus]
MSGEENPSLPVLRQQLSVARTEIHNLRQQLRALGSNQQREIEKIKSLLTKWQCTTCQHQQQQQPDETHENLDIQENIPLRPIGLISTWFPEKKGTPRQPGICATGRGKLTLFNTVFTNPEHALEGLEEILFYFHKNDAGHVRAKVSPPRLNGIRMGVFGTRSPHRPSPIGLSLVRIERVEGASIYFSGVDMVDGTPVFDIKPYIPQYDSPMHRESPNISSDSLSTLRLMEGRDADDIPGTSGQGVANSPAGAAASPLSLVESIERLRSDERIGEREAPDGEEGNHPVMNISAAPPDDEARPPLSLVRVPAWIAQPPLTKLSVTFSDRAKAQLESITNGMDSAESILNTIKSVLREDPRSVYLRERWGNQFYTFLICNMHVSCKFDDVAHCVTVFQVRSAAKLCDCGQLEWQCSTHSEGCA